MAITIGSYLIPARMLWPVHSSCPNNDLNPTGRFRSASPWGQAGLACVPLRDKNGARPSEDELKSGCNLGYAKSCTRLPADRHADAVRFALGEERDGVLHVRFASELAYLPAAHGELLYEKITATWVKKHDDACVQRMAECYVEVQLARRGQS